MDQPRTNVANVCHGGGNFTLTLADAQKGWTSTVQQHLAGTQLSSAEAIAEAPTVNGSTAPLTNFGGITFGITEVNGRKFTNYPYDTITMIDGQGLDKDIVYLTELGTLDVFWKRST